MDGVLHLISDVFPSVFHKGSTIEAVRNYVDAFCPVELQRCQFSKDNGLGGGVGLGDPTDLIGTRDIDIVTHYIAHSLSHNEHSFKGLPYTVTGTID